MNENNNKALAIMDLAMKISQNSEMDIYIRYEAGIDCLGITGYSRGILSGDPDMFMDSEGMSAYVKLSKGRSWDAMPTDTPRTLDSVLAELEKLWEGINGQAES